MYIILTKQKWSDGHFWWIDRQMNGRTDGQTDIYIERHATGGVGWFAGEV